MCEDGGGGGGREEKQVIQSNTSVFKMCQITAKCIATGFDDYWPIRMPQSSHMIPLTNQIHLPTFHLRYMCLRCMLGE